MVMATRYGNGGNGRGKRIIDDDSPIAEPAVGDEVEKIDSRRAYALQRSLSARGKDSEARRAFQVGRRADRGPAGNRELSQQLSLNDIEGSERQGLTRRAKRRGITQEDIYREIFARSDSGKAGRPNPFAKRKRTYDSQDRRMRRLGNYEAALGLGGAGAVGLGAHGVREDTKALTGMTVRGKVGQKDTKALNLVGPKRLPLVVSRRNAAITAGGVAGLAASGAIHRHANSNTGRKWK